MDDTGGGNHGLQGGGLDTTGTKEGFKKALALVPDDKNSIFSFENR